MDKKVKKVLVSVIMPVYNGMPFIKASIQSLLNQTYKDWECVIINDGSTDGTREFLNSLLDSRFKIIHLEVNKGRGYARQVGLDSASGKYLAMLDADDLYHSTKIEKQVAVLEKMADVVLVSCGLCSFGYKTPIIRVRGKGDNSVRLYSNSNSCPVAHASSMLRMDAAKKYNYNTSLNFGEDIDFLSKCLSGEKYLITDDVLYYYSEFDSVNINKIQKSYISEIQKYFVILGQTPISASILILKNTLKLIVSVFVFPVLGEEVLLKLRGNKASDLELDNFNETSNLINSK